MIAGAARWWIALAGAVGLHAALLLTINPPTVGETEPPAGPPVAVAGSLSGILGAEVSEPVPAAEAMVAPTMPPDASDPTGVTEPAAVPPIETASLAAPAPTEATPAPAVSAPAISAPAAVPATDVAVQVTTARSRTSDAVAAVTGDAARMRATETTKIVEPLPPVEQVPRPERQARRKPDVTPKKATRKPTWRAERTARREEQKKRAERAARQAKERARQRAKRRAEQRANQRRAAQRANRRKRQAARQRAGSRTQGAAGAARGGKNGRSRASPGAVRGYASRVRARIMRQRPGAAGRGRVVISFGVSVSGGLRYARIVRRSGNAALDRAALAAVRRAAPFPRPPRGATTRQLRFSIPFSFR